MWVKLTGLGPVSGVTVHPWGGEVDARTGWESHATGRFASGRAVADMDLLIACDHLGDQSDSGEDAKGLVLRDGQRLFP